MRTTSKKRLTTVWVSAAFLAGGLAFLSGCVSTPPIIQAYSGEPRPLDQVGFLVEEYSPTVYKVGLLRVDDETIIEMIDGVERNRQGKGRVKFALVPGEHVVVAYMPGFFRTLVAVAQDGPSKVIPENRFKWHVQLEGSRVVPIEMSDERIEATEEKFRSQTRRTVTFDVEAGATYILRGKFTADNELSPAGIWVERLE